MRVRRAFGLITVVMALLGGLVACGGGSDDGTESGGASPEAADPAEYDLDASLDIAYFLASQTLDPHMEATTAGRQGWSIAYDTLFLATESGPEPCLVTETEASDDGLSVTLQLRDDVSFSDGTPLDAEAVKANLDRVKAEGLAGLAEPLQPVTAVEVTGDHTVELTLSSPLPELAGLLSGAAGAVINPVALADPAKLATQTFGSGPYESVEFVPDEKAVYRRSPVEYWLPGAGNLAELTVWFVADPQTALNGLQSGDYDVVWTSATPEQADGLAQTGGYTVEYKSLGGVDSLGLRITHQQLGDIKVRQAIAHAIDRDLVADGVYGGACEPSSVPVPEGTQLFVEDYDPYPYDPDKARELIAEAGAEGMTVDLYNDGRPSSVLAAQAVQQLLNDVGFNGVVIPPEAGAGGIFAEGQHDGFYSSFTYEVPLTFLGRYLVTGGRFQLASPEDQGLLDLMEQVREPGLSLDEQNAIYQELGKEITDLAVMIPVCAGQSAVLADPKVLNLEDAHRWTVYDVRFLAVSG